MICPSCKAQNEDPAEACFTCGRALSALTQGSVIAGRYEVLSPLGKGGMGMVYKAHDRMLDETVAIKVLRSEFANTVEMLKRFKHEIKLARKVSHRNVCRIHEFGEDGGVRYISMEYVEGTDIKQLARDKGGFLDPEEAFDVAIQTADGLQAIHDVGHHPPRPQDLEHHAGPDAAACASWTSASRRSREATAARAAAGSPRPARSWARRST